jgi:hypothetical protein
MLKVSKVIGRNSDQYAAQALCVNEPDLPSLFVVVSSLSDDAFSKTRQVISDVRDIFYDQEESTPATQLHKTFDTIAQAFSDRSDTSILVGTISDNTLYLLYSGSKVGVFLFREGTQTDLCQIAPEKHLISGYLEENDRLLFTTKSLSKLLGDDWKKISEWRAEEFEDEVTGHMYHTEEPLASIMTIYSQREDGEIPEALIDDTRPAKSDLSDHESGYYQQSRNHKRLPNLRRSFSKIKPKSVRATIAMVLVCVILIGFVAGVIIKQRLDARQNAEFESKLTLSQQLFQQAMSLKDLNPTAARDQLNQSRTALTQALTVKPKDSKALDFKDELDKNAGVILKIFQVDQIPVWLDLDLVKKDFRGKTLSASVGKVLVLDPTQKSLVQISLSQKSQQIVTGGDKLGDAKLTALNGANAFVYSRDQGIIRVDTSTKQPTVAIKKDDNWLDVGDLYGFGGNVYLLDKAKNQIWKYVPAGTAYSEPRAYFAQNGPSAVASALRMHIDGSVWILASDGNLYKFTQGSTDHFVVTGLDQPLKNPQNFFLSDETKNIYILDTGNSRLVVIGKNGEYISQYMGEMIKNMLDVVVDEESKKIYLFDGRVIYALDLR